MKEVSRILAAAVLLSASFAAKGALFSFSEEYTGSGSTCANTVCATLSVTQNGDDVDFVLTANLESGEFIVGLYGNWDPFVNAEDRDANLGGTTDENSIVLSSGTEDSQIAGGGELFDWRFAFSPMPPRFDGDETFSWTFTDVGINDIIGAGSVDAGYTFVLRVQGLFDPNDNDPENTEGSGWFYATLIPNGNGRVPEPMTLALVGFGMLALGAVRRPRKLARRERRFRLHS